MKRLTKKEKEKIKLESIEEQSKKLRNLYVKCDNDDDIPLIENLIEEASFMYVTLRELKDKINANGIKERYKNGSNQYGYKDSVEVKTYNTMIKNYTSVIKQLNDMIPPQKGSNPEDEFDAFNGLK